MQYSVILDLYEVHSYSQMYAHKKTAKDQRCVDSVTKEQTLNLFRLH